FCHENSETARKLAWSYAVNQALKSTGRAFKGIPSPEDTADIELTGDERLEAETILSNLIFGAPVDAGDELIMLSEAYKVAVFMIVTITHNIVDKINSYRLLADQLLTAR